MRAVDTNILVRVFERDEPGRTALAESLLKGPDDIFVSSIVLCEFAWVLRSIYRRRRDEIAQTIRAMLDVDKLVMDREAVHSGLAVLEAGGDFSDGVVLHESRRTRCTDLVTFDHDLVRIASPEVDLLS